MFPGVRLSDGPVVLDRDSADDRLRFSLYEPGLSARHCAAHVPILLRHHHSGSNDRTRLRQAVETEEASSDAIVQQASRHLSPRRSALPAVPRRRHAEVTHRRGPGDTTQLLSYV